MLTLTGVVRQYDNGLQDNRTADHEALAQSEGSAQPSEPPGGIIPRRVL